MSSRICSLRDIIENQLWIAHKPNVWANKLSSQSIDYIYARLDGLLIRLEMCISIGHKWCRVKLFQFKTYRTTPIDYRLFIQISWHNTCCFCFTRRKTPWNLSRRQEGIRFQRTSELKSFLQSSDFNVYWSISIWTKYSLQIGFVSSFIQP